MVFYERSQTFSRQALLTDLNKTGVVLVKDVNPDSSSELLRLGRLLGSIDVGIDEELLGPVIMHLRYDPGKKSDLPAYFTSNEFPLHTDVSYVPNPPRFMLLHCIYPDPDGGGISILADCDKAQESLCEPERKMIRQKVFSFLYPPNCPEGQSQAYAISGDGLWRFKNASMHYPQEAGPAVESFEKALLGVSFRVLLERGDLLIIDNHRITHGRTAFSQRQSRLPARDIMRLYASQQIPY